MADMEADQDSPHLGHWVKILDHETIVRGNRLLKPYGLTRSSWYVLYHISQAGRVSQRKLQEILDIESGSMAIIVDGLVRKGWLDRISSETDRRANYLRLTPKGTARWKTVPDIVAVLRKQMMAGITKEEEATTVEILKRSWLNLRGPK